jgi:hypothetical protein
MRKCTYCYFCSTNAFFALQRIIFWVFRTNFLGARQIFFVRWNIFLSLMACVLPPYVISGQLIKINRLCYIRLPQWHGPETGFNLNLFYYLRPFYVSTKFSPVQYVFFCNIFLVVKLKNIYILRDNPKQGMLSLIHLWRVTYITYIKLRSCYK